MASDKRNSKKATKSAAASAELSGLQGRTVDLENLTGLRSRYKVFASDEAAGHYAIEFRFDPLSLDDGLSWHRDEGITGLMMTVEVEAGIIKALRLSAEFCTCGGHAVGGRAPAWIFASNPVDEIEEERIPPLARRRMHCVLGILEGGDKLGPYRAWHERTETGWTEEQGWVEALDRE